jgi:nitrite reductase/ring-hydroxylating ferredoxin subunit
MHAPGQEQEHDSCADHDHDERECRLAVDRRVFLRLAALGALGAVGALASGGIPAELGATVRTVRPLRTSPRELAYPVPDADGVSVDESAEVILVRWQNRAYAFSTSCPHKGATLRWRAAEGRVFCPKHKARFHPDGAHASGRRTRALDRYDIARRGATLVVSLDALHRADRDAAAWERAWVGVG